MNMTKKLNRVNSNTLTEQYLRESIIYLNKEYDRLGKKLKKDIESEISKVIKTTTDEQLSFSITYVITIQLI